MIASFKNFGELFHEVRRPCIPVGLKNDKEPRIVALVAQVPARRRDCGIDLCRVVGVVVIYLDLLCLALELEPALYAAE